MCSRFAEKQILEVSTIKPERSIEVEFEPGDVFSSNSLGVMCFWPYIKKYGIDKIINESDYPETKSISKFPCTTKRIIGPFFEQY